MAGADYQGVCTVGFSAIMAIVSFVASLPRTFDTLAKIATFSAFFTFISVLLAAIFAGIEAHPAKYNTGGPKGLFVGEPTVLVVPAAGTTFVSGMNAFLNISYTFIGQITIPSFIAEMKNPKDFPKALWAVTICEIIVFGLVGSVVYAYTGTQYNVAPAFGSLGNDIYKKVSFSFMIPTLIFLGVLYASVSARFIFFRVFEGTRHKGNHTFIGWASWAGILAALWILAFIVAEVIPFFSDLLSLMSSLFDSFFGFIFWGTAYIRMRKADYGPGWIQRRGIRGLSGFLLNVIIILIGLFMLTAGTYVSSLNLFSNERELMLARPRFKVLSIIMRRAPSKASFHVRTVQSRTPQHARSSGMAISWSIRFQFCGNVSYSTYAQKRASYIFFLCNSL